MSDAVSKLKSAKAKTVKPSLRDAKTPEQLEKMKLSEKRDGLTIDVESLGRIQTGAEAIIKAGFDPLVWEPNHVEATSWEVAVKLGSAQEGYYVEVETLWRVHVRCKRVVGKSIEAAADALAKRSLKKFKIPSQGRLKKRKTERTLIFGCVDHHYGKLTWAPETGSHYDLEIADKLWDASVEATLNEAGDATEIIFPVGNDFGHVDGKTLQTTAGTEQGSSTDGRYEKVSDYQEAALIRAVAKMRSVAPVKIIHVPGNHDRITSMWLCRVLHWAFIKDKHIQVDTTRYQHRLTKYISRGKCAWGFAHGDGPKPKALKDYMPVECPEWSQATECREWITGHTHTTHVTEKISTSEQAGMVFRVLPSLCAHDAWHHAAGFGIGTRAVQSYLYDNQWGLEKFIQRSAKQLMAQIDA